MKGNKYIIEIYTNPIEYDFEYNIMTRDGNTNCYYEYDGGIIENENLSIYDLMEQFQKDLVKEPEDEIVGFIIREL